MLTELVVVLSELAVADGAVLVDNAAELDDTRHPGGVAAEFDDFHFLIYIKGD